MRRPGRSTSSNVSLDNPGTVLISTNSSVSRRFRSSSTYIQCRPPFEKSQIFPVRNVTPSAVEMTLSDGEHICAKRHVNQTRGCGRGGQGPKPACRCA
jgi:hypothetical protein